MSNNFEELGATHFWVKWILKSLTKPSKAMNCKFLQSICNIWKGILILAITLLWTPTDLSKIALGSRCWILRTYCTPKFPLNGKWIVHTTMQFIKCVAHRRLQFTKQVCHKVRLGWCLYLLSTYWTSLKILPWDILKWIDYVDCDCLLSWNLTTWRVGFGIFD